ncbi:MAG: CRISPR-associated helicase Cas3' [Candidatus Cloacimonetes bacterium]|nr:CRISPR-associated helicase Cas3' [Candidatus Cloacimonadota bacterium]MBL7086897.1 CRISPR-associated helicase Cas3' [Candidatus Cloacimonadota bacterium]
MLLAKMDETTLQEHIGDCLQVSLNLQKVIPQLPIVAETEDFWDLLLLAILFHDVGKIHPEFQKVLRKQKNHWEHQRHEVYSTIFTNKLNIDQEKLILIQKAILAHHKTFFYLNQKYKTEDDLKNEMIFWSDKIDYHPEDLLENLRRIPARNISTILEFIKLKINEMSLNVSMQSIKYREIRDPVEEIVKKHKDINIDSKEFLQNMFLWGALKICDHYGSAGIKRLPEISVNNFEFLSLLSSPYHHQIKTWNYSGNAILIAPTGSGKTESAIGWIKKQMESTSGRVYYVLPYTASINAMHKRLTRKMENCEPADAEIVGLHHGKLLHYLANALEYSLDKNLIMHKLDQFKKLIHPFKIITPFQILKYFYGVKGYEMGLTNLAGAMLIFDEIHAYDVVTFAQIVTMLEYLTKSMKCRVLIMTATLPSFMVKELQKVLPENSIIKANNSFLESIQRHRIQIFEGNILEAINKLQQQFEEKRIIIVCNTVKQAQDCYYLIKDKYPNENICLLHSRFTGSDRMDKENQAYDKETRFLIGTQAIEVSLDIDYDMMITEPAPLDALLQRFGRVNRKAYREPSQVYICSESSGYDHKIYALELKQKTLKVLHKIDILKESEVQNLMDKVYPTWSNKDKMEFEDIKTSFKSSLSSLQPYCEYKENEEAFYEKFTGIRVLPAQFYREYKEKIINEDIIEAENLLVGLHRSTYIGLKYHKERSKIQIEQIAYLKNDKTKILSVLVAKCKYNSETGLDTDSFQEIEYDSFL